MAECLRNWVREEQEGIPLLLECPRAIENRLERRRSIRNLAGVTPADAYRRSRERMLPDRGIWHDRPEATRQRDRVGRRHIRLMEYGPPEDPLQLENCHLVDKKNFASSTDGLSYAIVTVSDDSGRCMIVVPTTDLPVDRSWWRPMGMRASGSHVADMTGMAVEPDWLLGKPDDYVLHPWFSVGAIRFWAVQVGGTHAVQSQFDTL